MQAHTGINKNVGFEDRRVFDRIHHKFSLRFSEWNKEREIEAQAVDISGAGIGFVSSKRLAPKTPLEIWLKIPDHDAPVYATGLVIWSKNLSGDIQKWRIGVRFIKANVLDLGQFYQENIHSSAGSN